MASRPKAESNCNEFSHKGSVVYGPRKALARTKFVHMGLSIDPHEQNQLIKHTIVV